MKRTAKALFSLVIAVISVGQVMAQFAARSFPPLEDLTLFMTHSKIDYGGKLGSYELKEKVVNFYDFDGQTGTEEKAEKKVVSVGLTGRRGMVQASVHYSADSISDIIEFTLDRANQPITTTYLGIKGS